MNSRTQQHVREEVSPVRKASTQRFRARMAEAPKAEKACTRCLQKEMDPLIKVGVAIRNRFLQQCRGFPPNHNAVCFGNRAAHDGNPLADALLSFRIAKQEDRRIKISFSIWFQSRKTLEPVRLRPR
jgi:hypothetical protein